MESKSEQREKYRKLAIQRKGRILCVAETDWMSSGELAIQTQEVYPEITPDLFIAYLISLEFEGMIEVRKGLVRLTQAGRAAQRKYMSGE